jgi:hypothetical protein
MRRFAFLLGSLLSLTIPHAFAAQMISNLTNPPPQPGIGDIQGIPSNQSFIGRFSTGLGSFSVNSVTLEFLTLPDLYPDPLSLQNFHLDFYQQMPGFGNLTLLGSLGNIQLDPTPTIFPGYTTYYAFSPLSPITLDPSSTYAVVASDTSATGYQEGLLFTQDFSAQSPVGWQMALSYFGPYNGPFTGWHVFGENLKFAVDATAIPEPSVALVCLLCATVLCSFRSRQVSPSST